MLYLAIDQHSKQITVCVRNSEGDTVLSRQVSTRPEKIEAFFQQLTGMDSEFMAILEVCGFNDWLIESLRAAQNRGCANPSPFAAIRNLAAAISAAPSRAKS
jgi:hypothetical protein